MLKRIAFLSLLSLSMLLATGSPAYAVETPLFSSCLNPQGSIKANYDTGKHGIVGSTQEYSGKDTVYTQANGNALQCFCASDGSGIQTNWMKATGLSDDDIKVLKSNGWTFIPDGSLWGLDPAPYMAQNSGFSCQGSSNSGGGSTSSNGGSSNSTSGTSNGVSAVLGAASALAGTGNMQQISYIFGFGLMFLLLGYVLKRLGK